MSFEDTQKHLDQIIEKFDGDRFAATAYIFHKANMLNSKIEDSVSIPESISWAITDKEPENLDLRIKQHMNLKVHKTKYLEELMEFILDERIELAVRESFNTSMKTGSLTFFYKDITEPEIKRRVRILTRMVWYHKEDDTPSY